MTPVTARESVNELVRLEPIVVSCTASPPLAVRSDVMLAPAGSCICSASTVATVEVVAALAAAL